MPEFALSAQEAPPAPAALQAVASGPDVVSSSSNITGSGPDFAGSATGNAELAGLSPDEQARALKLIHRDSCYSQPVTTLTTGVFLVGFALQYKAPNFIIGLLAALPALAQLVQLAALVLLDRRGNRRKLCVLSTLLARLWLLPMALTPFLPPPGLSILVLVVAYAFHSACNAVSLCAWNAWLKDVVPAGRLGSFFSRKLSLTILMTILPTLLGGCFIDAWTRQGVSAGNFSYGMLFGFASLIGLVGTVPLSRIPDPDPNNVQAGQKTASLQELLNAPWRDRNFRQLIIFMGSWNFAVNLATPFFAVYMLTMLGYPMALVTGLTIVCQCTNFLFVRLWGRLADRFSNKSVLSVSAPIYIACLLGWTFIPYHGSIGITLPAALTLHILLGMASAGVTLAVGSIALKLAPAGKSTGFLALNSMVSNLATGLAPILGGLSADWFARQHLSLVLQWQGPNGLLSFKTLDFQYWDFFFASAFLLGLFSLARLNRVTEPGDVRKKVIMRELIAETARALTQVPKTARCKEFLPFAVGVILSALILLK